MRTSGLGKNVVYRYIGLGIMRQIDNHCFRIAAMFQFTVNYCIARARNISKVVGLND